VVFINDEFLKDRTEVVANEMGVGAVDYVVFLAVDE
jgi:hypothetical protein